MTTREEKKGCHLSTHNLVFLLTDKSATADEFLYYVSVFKNETVPVEELGRKSPAIPIIINQNISEGKLTARNLNLVKKGQLLNHDLQFQT